MVAGLLRERNARGGDYCGFVAALSPEGENDDLIIAPQE